jgi:DNA-binding IclR family transcriptional regulator
MPVTGSAIPLTRQIRGEYLESSGLRLTAAQAQKLWNLDQVECVRVLHALVSVGFLRQARDGTYVRSN